MEIDPGFEQMGREAVAQRVDAPGLRDVRPGLGALIRFLQARRVGRVARVVAARKQPVAGARCLPVRAQCGEQVRRQDRVAIMTSLALHDADGHACRVNVRDAQVRHFGETQAGCVGQQHDRAVLERRRLLDQSLDFVRTQHDRQSAGLAGRRDREDGALALQRCVKEEPQATDDDVARAPRPLPVAEEMHEIRLHFRVRDSIGRPAIEAGEACDGPEVGFAGPVRKPPRQHVIIHPTAELRHHTPPRQTNGSMHVRQRSSVRRCVSG
jgi:hypothetical protein